MYFVSLLTAVEGEEGDDETEKSNALIDSGCTRSLVKSSVCGPPSGHKTEVLTVDGKSMTSRGITIVNLRVDKRNPVVVDMLAIDGDLLGFDLLFGLDVI